MPKLRILSEQEFLVTANIPVHGAEIAARLEVKFRVLSRKKLMGFMALTGAVKTNFFRRSVEYLKLCWRAKRYATTVDMLNEVIVEWTGEIDAEYSRAALRTLLVEYPLAGIGLYAAYLEGMHEARIKN